MSTDKLQELKAKLAKNTDKDVQTLLAAFEELQKKNEVLSNHVMELTQEMENIKMDFGNNR